MRKLILSASMLFVVSLALAQVTFFGNFNSAMSYTNPAFTTAEKSGKLSLLHQNTDGMFNSTLAQVIMPSKNGALYGSIYNDRYNRNLLVYNSISAG